MCSLNMSRGLKMTPRYFTCVECFIIVSKTCIFCLRHLVIVRLAIFAVPSMVNSVLVGFIVSFHLW